MKKEVSAEMLLGYLYPERERKWQVNCRGTFYRNYNDDSLSVYPETGVLDLARDGFLKTLPDGMLTGRNGGKKTPDNDDRQESEELREAILNEAFAPFDSFTFSESLDLDREVSDMLDNKWGYVLRTYFDFDPETEKDPLVRKAAGFLLTARSRRGSLDLIRIILMNLFHCNVEMDCSHRYSEVESNRAWLPMVVYTLPMPGLSPEECRERMRNITPLKEFLRDRFVPLDVMFDIRLRDRTEPWEKSKGIVLDYNCQM